MRLIDADALLAELNAINAPYRADINNAITNAPTLMPEYEYKLAKQMLEILHKKLDEGMMTGETD